MNEETPEVPGGPPLSASGGRRQEQTKGGFLGLGTLFGALSLYVIYFWGTVVAFGPPHAWSNSFLAGPAAFFPVAIYLGLAVILAVTPRTSRSGTGMLIGLGLFTLLGGGLCVGSLVVGT